VKNEDHRRKCVSIEKPHPMTAMARDDGDVGDPPFAQFPKRLIESLVRFNTTAS